MTDARVATLEELVGHSLDKGHSYRLSLPSEVGKALDEGWMVLETIENEHGVPFILFYRKDMVN